MTPEELKAANADLAAVDAALDQLIAELAADTDLIFALAGGTTGGPHLTREELIALHGKEKIEFANHKALTLAACVLARHRMSRIIFDQSMTE